MHPSNTPAKALIRKTALCVWLDITPSGLDKLKARDSTFPKPIKDSPTRQAAAYYVVSEVEAWLKRKIEQRDSESVA